MPLVYKPKTRKHYTEQALKGALKKLRELCKDKTFYTYNLAVTSDFKSVM